MTDRARRLSRTTRRVAGLAVLIAAGAPGVAEASVASRAGAQISITAGSGEANDILFRIGGGPPPNITDSAGITAAGDCAQVSATAVDCGPYPDVVNVTVQLGDGNDQFKSDELLAATFDIDGGTGDDIIDGGSKNDVIHGGPGNDTIFAYSGDDQVFGDEGDDSVKGASGSDRVSGGPGRDLVHGDGQGAYFDGSSDVIDSRDGEVDQVTCGYGADTVTADANDVIESGGECESVDAAAAVDPDPQVEPGPDQGGTFGVALGARSSAKIAKLLSKQGFPFAIAVNAPCRGTGKLVVAAAEAKRRGLGHNSVTLASQTVDVPTAGIFAAALTARSKYRKKLKSLKQVRTTLSFACVYGGVTRRKSKKVTFTRR